MATLAPEALFLGDEEAARLPAFAAVQELTWKWARFYAPRLPHGSGASKKLRAIARQVTEQPGSVAVEDRLLYKVGTTC